MRFVPCMKEKQAGRQQADSSLLVRTIAGEQVAMRAQFRALVLFACCEATCPTHALGAFLDVIEEGEQAFAGISPTQALAQLRLILKALRIESWEEYRTHDLRRGHAQDLVEAGACSAVIVAVVYIIIAQVCSHAQGPTCTRSCQRVSGPRLPS